MAPTKIQQLGQMGQSIWFDYINRSMLESGKLKKLIKDGVRGMTSNPTIFNQAISTSADYDQRIRSLKSEGKSIFEIYDELTVEDIKDATDAFRCVYEETSGLDGYVSLEINPLLANKVEEQIQEGLRLFKKVDRPNLMIKVPCTKEGYVVIEELIASGVNVNATLIFSISQYEETVKAYLRGLQRLSESSSDISQVKSVASVFVSRIDAAVDKKIDAILSQDEVLEDQKFEFENLKGKSAVANSRLIFEKFKELFQSDEFKCLKEKGASIQRVLWASTGTKNPAYSDIKYVTELIHEPTINTLPEKTLMAFRDHGQVQSESPELWSRERNQEIISNLKSFGIDIDEVCQNLLDDGVRAFNKAFESLLQSIEEKSETLTLKV